MKQILVAATLLSTLYLASGQAAAEKVLTSGPLRGGVGGVVCACTNLTKKAIVVHFTMNQSNGGFGCNDQNIDPGRTNSCELAGTLVKNCLIRRDDGKSVSAKHLACTFATLDANGNTTAVVLVDKKRKL